MQVKWKHPHGQDGEEPTHGYYLTIQEILKKLKLDAPDFVHVERNVMSVRIRGLKPASTYEIKARLQRIIIMCRNYYEITVLSILFAGCSLLR